MRHNPTTARFALLAPAILAMSACGSETTADETVAANNPEATATATTAVVASDATQLPLTAQAFADAVTASNNFEIQSARIVQAIGPGQPLTDYTQMMIRDHENSSNELGQVINSVQGATIDDQKLTEEQERNLAALRQAASPEMAEMYKRQQIEAHKKTLAMLQTYAASGDDQALMGFAAKSIPIIQRHLAEAQKLP